MMRRARWSDQKPDDRTVTVEQARAQLTLMLTTARSIDHLTVDSLARMYRVPRREIEQRLEIEQRRRAAR
jgi:hypothetical protein